MRRGVDYTAAYQRMIKATHTPEAPWYIVPADDKRRARLNSDPASARQHTLQEGQHRPAEDPEGANAAQRCHRRPERRPPNPQSLLSNAALEAAVQPRLNRPANASRERLTPLRRVAGSLPRRDLGCRMPLLTHLRSHSPQRQPLKRFPSPGSALAGAVFLAAAQLLWRAAAVSAIDTNQSDPCAAAHDLTSALVGPGPGRP